MRSVPIHTRTILYGLLCFGLLVCVVCIGFYFPHRATITFHDWWGESPEIAQRTEMFFQKILGDTLYRYDSIAIYSVFPKGTSAVSRNPKCLTIQYSAESTYRNPELFDINILPGVHTEHRNVMPIPYMFLEIYLRNIPIQRLLTPRKLDFAKKKKFCLFAVSNCDAPQRNEFYHALNKRKPVDSCGKCFNNLGFSCPGFHRSKEYFAFISQYKFVISFENVSKENYLTEKLFNAYNCGTVPIYWGCTNVGDYVNTSSFLYLPPKYTQIDLETCLDTILRLDANDDLYRDMYERSFFSRVPDAYNARHLQKRIQTMLS